MTKRRYLAKIVKPFIVNNNIQYLTGNGEVAYTEKRKTDFDEGAAYVFKTKKGVKRFIELATSNGGKAVDDSY